MNEPNDFDPIDRFLEGDFASAPNEELRGRLLKRTGGVLRRRRRLRQGAQIAALIACFVGGVASGRWLEHPKTIEPQIIYLTPPPAPDTSPEKKTPSKAEHREVAQKASPSDLE